MNRIDRLLALLFYLQRRRRATCPEIAQAFNLSLRTVYRDMAALQEIGVPLAAQAGEGYTLLESFHLPPVMLREQEAMALILGAKMLQASGNMPQEAGSALDKVAAALPSALRKDAERKAEIIQFIMPVGRFKLDDPLLDQIQRAIQEKRVLRLRYFSYQEQTITERDVEPLTLSYGQGTWYIAAYCRLREDYRDFRVDRIEQMTTLPERFRRAPRPPASPAELRPLRLRVAASVLRWVQERQHYGFVEALPDEDGAMLMRYAVQRFEEIIPWILSWGAQVEVLEPNDLRDQIRAELEFMLARLNRS